MSDEAHNIQDFLMLEEKSPEQIRQEDIARVLSFRLLDDTFARCAFRGHMDLAEFVLRVITQINDLRIDKEGYETQFDAKRLAGSRSLMLDVHGGDTQGRKYDLEMEKSDASPERAEVHVAAMVGEHLHANEPFKNLPEIYVIFMCEHDVIGNGRAVNQYCYRNEDRFLENESIEEGITASSLMGGRTHIIFVNGDYKNEETEIGKLIHDFKCSQADDMYFPNLADRVRRMKEDPEEVDKVCKVIEDVRKESEERTEQRTLVRAIRDVMASFNVSAEKAMDSLHVPADQQQRYAKIVSSQAYR